MRVPYSVFKGGQTEAVKVYARSIETRLTSRGRAPTWRRSRITLSHSALAASGLSADEGLRAVTVIYVEK
jgi:hypothetical protein